MTDEVLSADDVRKLLTDAIEAEGSQAKLADKIGVTGSFISAALHHKEPSGKILAFLGVERVQSYRRVAPAEAATE